MSRRGEQRGATLDELAGIVPDPETYRPPSRNYPPAELSGGEDTYNVGPVDIAGWQDWGTLCTWEVRKFRWGSVVAGVEANNDGYGGYLQGEIRVIGYVGAQGFVLAEDAVAHHTDQPDTYDTGPLRLVLREGELPDRIEVQARAIGADGRLTATVHGRFGA
jgi:hypothetical protein